jgi:hypothetical protein
MDVVEIGCEIVDRIRPLTNKLTPWSKVLLEKLRVTQLGKKFLAFYGN